MSQLKDHFENANLSILLVEDDRLILSTIGSGLVRAGYIVGTAESVDEAENWLEKNNRPDIVILDVHMPGRNGLELTKRLSDLNKIPFILLTAYSEPEVVIQANESGAMGYLVKPVDITQLIPAIKTAISRSRELECLRGTTQNLQIALDADRSVSVAVGIIMDQRGLGQKEALSQLRKTARSNHTNLSDLANKIINSREILNLEIGT